MSLCSLHCGDSVEVVSVLPGGFDVVVTSPPYWASRDYGVDGQWGVETDPQEFIDRVAALMRLIASKATADAFAFVVINDTRVSNFDNARRTSYWSSKSGEGGLLSGRGAYPRNTMRRNSWGVPLGATLSVPWRLGLACAPEWSLKAELIWDKGVGRHTNSKSPARAHETVLMLARDPRRPASGQSVVRVRPDGSGTSHPAPFPPELAGQLLDMASPVRGPVLDPFCGCGATGVACAGRGLDFVGVDLKQSYIDEARDRLGACGPKQASPKSP